MKTRVFEHKNKPKKKNQVKGHLCLRWKKNKNVRDKLAGLQVSLPGSGTETKNCM